HSDKGQAELPPPGPGYPGQRLAGVPEQIHGQRCLARSSCNDRRDCALPGRLAQVIVAVEVIPFQSQEQLALSEGTRIRRNGRCAAPAERETGPFPIIERATYAACFLVGLMTLPRQQNHVVRLRTPDRI